MKPSGLLKSVMVSPRLPFWKLLANVDSGPKVERELRTFSNRLRRHQLGEGVISLNEHSTNLLSDMVGASNVLKCYYFFLSRCTFSRKLPLGGSLSTTTTFSRAGYGSSAIAGIVLVF